MVDPNKNYLAECILVLDFNNFVDKPLKQKNQKKRKFRLPENEEEERFWDDIYDQNTFTKDY